MHRTEDWRRHLTQLKKSTHRLVALVDCYGKTRKPDNARFVVVVCSNAEVLPLALKEYGAELELYGSQKAHDQSHVIR